MERAHQNMRDIVRWQRNNPCILFWEPILNESEMSYEIQKEFHDKIQRRLYSKRNETTFYNNIFILGDV